MKYRLAYDLVDHSFCRTVLAMCVQHEQACAYSSLSMKGKAPLLLLLQDKQRGSALLAGNPLADITPRQQQLTPAIAPLPSLTKQHSSGACAGASALTTSAVAGQENVEEQCLSAGRWLRGLAEECLESVYTPARLQSADAADPSQVRCSAMSWVDTRIPSSSFIAAANAIDLLMCCKTLLLSQPLSLTLLYISLMRSPCYLAAVADHLYLHKTKEYTPLPDRQHLAQVECWCT